MAQQAMHCPLSQRTKGGDPRTTKDGQARTREGGRTSSNPTCPRTLWAQLRIHQHKTTRNTPVMEHTAKEPAQHGKGLRNTQKTHAAIMSSQEIARGSPKILTRGKLGPKICFSTHADEVTTLNKDTAHLGSTNKLCLCWKSKQVNLLGMT